jgi:TRAP-type mannitol/chloroaromatic compound transport system substrate-binding protein
MINADAWASLPPDLQSIVATACQAITTDMLAEYTHGNAQALRELIDDPKIDVRPFPDEVLRLLKSHTQEIIDETSATDPAWKKIAESYYGFISTSTENQRVTELANLKTRDL